MKCVSSGRSICADQVREEHRAALEHRDEDGLPPHVVPGDRAAELVHPAADVLAPEQDASELRHRVGSLASVRRSWWSRAIGPAAAARGVSRAAPATVRRRRRRRRRRPGPTRSPPAHVGGGRSAARTGTRPSVVPARVNAGYPPRNRWSAGRPRRRQHEQWRSSRSLACTGTRASEPLPRHDGHGASAHPDAPERPPPPRRGSAARRPRTRGSGARPRRRRPRRDRPGRRRPALEPRGAAVATRQKPAPAVDPGLDPRGARVEPEHHVAVLDPPRRRLIRADRPRTVLATRSPERGVLARRAEQHEQVGRRRDPRSSSPCGDANVVRASRAHARARSSRPRTRPRSPPPRSRAPRRRRSPSRAGARPADPRIETRSPARSPSVEPAP